MNRKGLFVLGIWIASLVIYAGCSNPETAKQKSSDSIGRDTIGHPAPLPRPDTIDTIHPSADVRDTGIPENIYDQYIAGYTSHCIIDSSFKLATARFKLHVEHLCTFDSGIVVPKSYVQSYKLDSFVTHDFVTRVTLLRNGKKILDRTLTKRDFWLRDRSELAQYAVLSCPALEIQLGTVTLNYSISIPLTDVSVAATADIDEKGSMRFHVGD